MVSIDIYKYIKIRFYGLNFKSKAVEFFQVFFIFLFVWGFWGLFWGVFLLFGVFLPYTLTLLQFSKRITFLYPSLLVSLLTEFYVSVLTNI